MWKGKEEEEEEEEEKVKRRAYAQRVPRIGCTPAAQGCVSVCLSVCVRVCAREKVCVVFEPRKDWKRESCEAGSGMAGRYLAAERGCACARGGPQS
jgi:hypothetical protein